MVAVVVVAAHHAADPRQAVSECMPRGSTKEVIKPHSLDGSTRLKKASVLHFRLLLACRPSFLVGPEGWREQAWRELAW